MVLKTKILRFVCYYYYYFFKRVWFGQEKKLDSYPHVKCSQNQGRVHIC